MATGFLVRGVCYETPEKAIAGFMSLFPQMEGGDLWNLYGLPTYGNTQIMYALQNARTGTFNYGQVMLNPCDTSAVPADPLFTVVMFAACAIMFGLGFIGTR